MERIGNIKVFPVLSFCLHLLIRCYIIYTKQIFYLTGLGLLSFTNVNSILSFQKNPALIPFFIYYKQEYFVDESFAG